MYKETIHNDEIRDLPLLEFEGKIHLIEDLQSQEEVAEKDKTRNMLLGGGLLLLLVAGGLFSRNRYVNRSRKAIQKDSTEITLNRQRGK